MLFFNYRNQLYTNITLKVTNTSEILKKQAISATKRGIGACITSTFSNA